MSGIWVCSRFIEGREPKDEEKWKVISDYTDEYEVGAHSPTVNSGTHWIPKSDYIPCPAPEQWEPVEVAVGSLDARTGIQHILCHYPHKRLWELRGRALARPCAGCGYVQEEIKSQ